MVTSFDDREQRRMDFHKDKMTHMHLLESKLRPEMTVKPSALWQKRKVVVAKRQLPHPVTLLDPSFLSCRDTKLQVLRIEGSNLSMYLKGKVEGMRYLRVLNHTTLCPIASAVVDLLSDVGQTPWWIDTILRTLWQTL